MKLLIYITKHTLLKLIQNPFFFILNCAVGGNAAGEVSTKGWTNKGTVNGVTTWEDYYYVDYVRVYQ